MASGPISDTNSSPVPSAMLTNKATCDVPVQFHKTLHTLDNFLFEEIETVHVINFVIYK